MLLVCTPAPACGPYALLTYFWNQAGQELPLARLMDGEVLPFERLRPIEAFVLYRWLTDNPVASDQRHLVLATSPGGTDRSLATEPSPKERWVASRAAALAGMVSIPEPPGQLDTDYRWTEDYQAYRNCHEDAYRVAARTLEARIATWGEGSEALLEWLAGQDAVFANCGGGAFSPRPAESSWPRDLRFDRAYQSAAALFYSERWPEAESAFLDIADDERSPWRATSAYVAARAMTRQGRYDAARDQLQAVMADPELESMHRASASLVRFVRYRNEPAAVHAETRRMLLESRLPESFGQLWIDYLWGLRRVADLESDLDLWILALTRKRHPYPPQTGWEQQRVLKRAAEEPGRVWRFAASVIAQRPLATDAEFDRLLEDTMPSVSEPAPGPASGPASGSASGPLNVGVEASVMAFHRARMLLDRGRFDEADEILSVLVPRAASWPRGARNLLRELEARGAPDLPSLLELATAPPVGLSWGGQYPADFEHQDIDPDRPILLDLGISVLQRLPPRSIADLATGARLSEPVADRLLAVAFVRALIAMDHETLTYLAPIVESEVPTLAGAARAYGAAAEDEREFVSGLILLWNPHPPWLAYGVADDASHRESGGWWCDGPGVKPWHDPLPVRAEIPVDPRWQETLRSLVPAPELLANRVFPRAETHPKDPRVPEALHRLVVSTRHACGPRFGPISKNAFDLLHRRYPNNPWTEQTPYWFGERPTSG